MFIDCSRVINNGMPAFRLKNEDGSVNNFQVKIEPLLTRDQTKPKFSDNVSFEITQITLQCVVGTYLDSPYHRYEGRESIAELSLDQTIGEGVVIDARGLKPWESFSDTSVITESMRDKIVLFNFDWDKYFGTEDYHSYPFISKEVIDTLAKTKPKIVGVDTVNIDNSNDLSRPAHSKLLNENILIVENLMNLDKLHGKEFNFYAVPVKIEQCASFPVRAFAEIIKEETLSS